MKLGCLLESPAGTSFVGPKVRQVKSATTPNTPITSTVEEKEKEKEKDETSNADTAETEDQKRKREKKEKLA